MLFTRVLHLTKTITLCALLLAAAWSCSENKNNSDRGRDRELSPQSMPNMQPKGVGMKSAPKGDAGGVTPPADAQWTIYCQAIGGPAHVEMANNLKAQLLKTSGMKDWYVIHEDSQSVLYYGFYRAIDTSDRKEAEREHADQRQIQSMADSTGERLFPHSFPVEVTTPDPQAPAEWNLANADGYWSLQIAAYKDSPRRKQFAVDAVRDARAQGLPAYYFHGENTSMVFIGAWPRSAVKEQDAATATNSDPSRPLLVLSQPVPITDVRERDTGNSVQTVAPRLEPLDPSLLDAMQKYPNNVVNGMLNVSRIKDPVTGQVREIPDPSFLVVIPRKQTNLLESASGLAAPQMQMQVTAPTEVLAPGTAQQPQQQQMGGRLRSLQD
ncbi:MAG TPA: hypothetical protein VF669_16725 [Tepidisphaeraceae bacterium]|jgi:hypothetical protein